MFIERNDSHASSSTAINENFLTFWNHIPIEIGNYINEQQQGLRIFESSQQLSSVHLEQQEFPSVLFQNRNRTMSHSAVTNEKEE